MSPARALAGALIAAALGGCSLAPRYETPQVETPPSYRETGDWMPVAEVPPRAGAWWQAFGDPQLDALEERLLERNLDLQVAAARYAQARAVARVADAQRLPALGAGVDAQRQRNSANAPLASGVSTVREDYDAGLQFAWELDLFGRLRNAAAAAHRRAEAGAAELGSVQLALTSQLAGSYFALRGTDETLSLLEDTRVLFERALELTRNRYAGGVAAATDVDQAQTQLNDARAQLAVARLQRAQLEHAIAVLLGVPPAQFALEVAPFVGSPPPLPPLLPAELLRRRPDIASAERQVAAANAEIGVARAAWFPVFSLRAAGGYESMSTSTWFDAPSRYWALGPAAALSLFDLGAKAGGTRQARAAFDAAAANYRQTVLVAYQEVEDQLAALRHLGDALTANESASESARSAANHATRRYEAGIADYIEVTTTQGTALSAQRAAIDARVRRMTAAVTLLRALGGDWQAAATARTMAR